MADLGAVVAQLKAERAKLDKAIEVLSGGGGGEARQKMSRCGAATAELFCTGLDGLNRPILWAFPRLAVCLDCREAKFIVPEKALQFLVLPSAQQSAFHRYENDAKLFPEPSLIFLSSL
jgi:hypothetical protein